MYYIVHQWYISLWLIRTQQKSLDRLYLLCYSVTCKQMFGLLWTPLETRYKQFIYLYRSLDWLILRLIWQRRKWVQRLLKRLSRHHMDSWWKFRTRRQPDLLTQSPACLQPCSVTKYFRIENGQVPYYYAHLFSEAFHNFCIPFYQSWIIVLCRMWLEVSTKDFICYFVSF